MEYNNIFECICDNRFSTLMNFLSTSIGAFLGFLFGLILYWIGNTRSRNRKNREEKQKAYDTLKHFSTLLKELISSCELQNIEFNDYANKLSQESLYNHMPISLATNDRNRLIKSDNLELFHAFMFFENDNPSKYDDYRRIFKHADFIQQFYDELLIQSEKHQNFTFSDFIVIRDNLLSIDLSIERAKRKIQLENLATYNQNEEFQFLEKYRNIYLGLKFAGFANFKPYKDDFLIPFQDELRANISDQNQVDELLTYIATILTRMEHVILNTQEHATYFANLDKTDNVNSALLYFGKNIKKIEKNIKP